MNLIRFKPRPCCTLSTSPVGPSSFLSLRIATCAIAMSTAALPVFAQQSAAANYLPTITTIAGTGAKSFSGDGGPATAAALNNPTGLGWDAAGNLYFVDLGRSSIREIYASTGLINTVVGNGAAGFVDNAAGTVASFNKPQSIYVDAAGNIYIADTSNYRIRKWNSAANLVTTVAGTGTSGSSGDGGPATSATLGSPVGVFLDAWGNVYISDSKYGTVRVIYENGPVSAVPGLATAAAAFPSATPQAGNIYTLAGISGMLASAGDGGAATSATLTPRHVSVDTHSNLYVTDFTHFNERRVLADTDFIATIAGDSLSGSTGDGGSATSASLSGNSASREDLLGNLYIADSNNEAIRVVDPQTQSIYTIAGQIGIPGLFGSNGDGGLSTAGALNLPLDISFSPAGVLAIADSGSHLIRAVTPPVTNFATTAVGSASAATSFTLGAVKADTLNTIATAGAAGDFTLASTGCVLPATVAAGPTNCVPAVKFTPTAPGLRISQLVTTDNAGARAILPLTGIGSAPAVSVTPGILTNFAGTPGTAGSSGDGGSATSATLTAPAAVAVDAVGNVYIAGSGNRVRVVSPTGMISAFAGTGAAGFAGDYGSATAAQLNNPKGLAVAPNGDLYIADTGNNVIRMVGAEAGVIRSVSTPGLLNAPSGVALDKAGNLYIADTGNNVVREIGRYNGFVSSLAGTVGQAGKTGDGAAATSALLNAPAGIALDSAGNIYIADTGNNEVREINLANGTIATVAGNGTAGNSGDGGPATQAQLSSPSQVAVDAAGDIFISCAGSNTVRMVAVHTGTINTVAGTGGGRTRRR